MKRLAIVLLTLMVSTAYAWNPAGTWNNLDSSSGGIDHLVIGDDLMIQGYGQCSPNPCEWGTTGLIKLVATNDSGNDDRSEYIALWNFDFKTTVLILSPHPENPNYIVVRSYDFYAPSDGRQNRYTIEYLKRSSP